MRAALLWLWFTSAAFAAPPPQVPVAPSVPAKPVPQQRSAVPPPAPPKITGYNLIGCVARGGVLNVIGSGFGMQQGARGVALGGYGLHVDLTIDAWSDTRVRVRIPADPRIEADQWYYVGVEGSDHSQWLSNIDRNFQICAGGAVLSKALTPSLPQPAGGGLPAPGAKAGDAGQGDGSEQAGSEWSGGGADSSTSTGSGTLIGSLPPPAATARPPPPQDDSIEPGELLVVSADLAQAQQVQAIAAQLGYAVKRRSVLTGLGLVMTTFRLTPDTPPAQALALLREQAPDLWADFNQRLGLQGGDSARTYAARLVAWPQRREGCGSGLRIGIVDTPLPDDHPALRGAAITRRNFVTHGVEPAPPGHALAVAALLDGSDGTGLTPAAALFVAEVMRQRDGRHIDTTVEWLVQGLDWLVRQHVDLVNLSLGGARNLIMEAAIARVLAQGIPVVAAAGNNGPGADPVYPAAQDGVIAVTAVDADRRIYRKANRGDYIRFAAPGVDVWVPRVKDSGFVSGTSFAAPFVAAALAAERQAQPKTDWKTLIGQLEQRATDLGDPGRDTTFGVGLIRAPAACGASQ